MYIIIVASTYWKNKIGNKVAQPNTCFSMRSGKREIKNAVLSESKESFLPTSQEY